MHDYEVKNFADVYNLTLSFHLIAMHFLKICSIELFILNSVIFLSLTILYGTHLNSHPMPNYSKGTS